MKNLFALLLAVILLTACDENPDKAGTAKDSDTTATPAFDPATHEQEIMQNPVVATENNTESAYKLVTTMPEYSMFGVLVSLSKYAKQLHHENWVILAPSNMVLQKYDINQLSLLKDSANRKILNDFIGKHIIKSPFSYKKMTDLKQVETITGKKVPVSYLDQTVNGVKLSGIEFYTKMGTVESIEGVIDYPGDILSQKMQSKKAEKEAN